MNRFRGGAALLLAYGVAAGCGRGSSSTTAASSPRSVPFQLAAPRLVSLGQGHVEKPQMAIVSPVDKVKVGPREVVQCKVELRVKDDGELPTQMYATFYSGVMSCGRYYLEPRGKTPDGVYHFAARMDAPRKKGVYALRGEANYSVIDGDATKAKIVRFATEDVTTEVQ